LNPLDIKKYILLYDLNGLFCLNYTRKVQVLHQKKKRIIFHATEVEVRAIRYNEDKDKAFKLGSKQPP
jgi:hypothetical protein